MTPEMTQAWKDTLAYHRSERDKFRALAQSMREEARELRKHKHFVEALNADMSAQLHRESAITHAMKMAHAKVILKGGEA